ncbi:MULTISPECIES: type I methionyl aminopeptidase [unclassified Campylobacter]|uniref:type I methionyl aminopeptidase n=1 Tax=unclassified Campylobacter TaxID=2593542 RepID=UPI0012382DD7|nr:MULTISPECIES: type I methionyl aminopeptidase [unclassified Campylobacter]KAA6225097.1 type I methionyl aminopeptidase [Campylobacter sp. LR196d]KAA6226111.1 type I methionyl aminopeptidase [Campylobacter sp. LR185c]KAA6228058.1 type I methionyl aminopeptidase [Campylobacter sp. LR286c]KAA6231311.1 type I methionyl aminopeptidase [Campylobacter sp. LR264d]KAA6231523.1 type I methionyl aminopeptidase [Campylobacter sp. LR291e]
MIELRKPVEIEKIRKANQIVARTLDYLEKEIKVGMSLKQVDKMAEEFILSQGAKPAFKGLYGFEGAICISLNEICIHGIPDDSILKDGDIVGLDIGSVIDGYYGDAARTIGIGEISEENKKLIACAKDALYYGIDFIKEGLRFKELSAALGEFITKRGFVPLRGYCGHGIGHKPHLEPEILNYLEKGVNAKAGPKIKNGMVFCIEPMICQKDGTPKHYRGKWNAGSVDGLNTAHYEHCVAVINGRAEILSQS